MSFDNRKKKLEEVITAKYDGMVYDLLKNNRFEIILELDFDGVDSLENMRVIKKWYDSQRYDSQRYDVFNFQSAVKRHRYIPSKYCLEIRYIMVTNSYNTALSSIPNIANMPNRVMSRREQLIIDSVRIKSGQVFYLKMRKRYAEYTDPGSKDNPIPYKVK